MAHEAIEVGPVGLLAEADLHRTPVVFVELGLMLRFKPHQDVVANQVGLAAFAARRVYALEDERGVVLISVERSLDEQELAHPPAQALSVGDKTSTTTKQHTQKT